MQEIADAMGITLADVKKADEELKEFNPMMGHRGCRLDVTYPANGVIQTRAIISLFASSPPVVNPDAATVSMVWRYIGELVFNMLVLVGASKWQIVL